MPEPNILLDALLDEAGISHAGLASRINVLTGRRTMYDHTAVARWIRDHAIPRGRVPELVCEILGPAVGRVLTVADIGMDTNNDLGDLQLDRVVDQAIALWRSDLTHTKALRDLRTIDGSAAVAPVFEWENPPDDLDVSRAGRRRVGRTEIVEISAARACYEEMYRRVGGVPTQPRVVTFLNASASLLRGSYDDATGRDLMRSLGGLVALAGVCAYDADLQAVAQRYLMHALRLAKASGNKAFGGYVVALLGNQAMYRGRYRLVIQYAESALRAARGHLSPALQTDLHTLQARAFVRMGDHARCREHMRESESVAARIKVHEEPPETGYVQPGLLETQHADALRHMGDLVAAEDYAEQAVRSATHLRGQVHRLATLAQIQAARGHLDEAVSTGDALLDLAHGMESGRIQDRVRTVARTLRAHNSAALADFLGRAGDRFPARR